MKKIYYEKVGRKYVPVYEYDNDFLDAWPRGTHLVTCHPGGTSRRYNIDPDYAALYAAGIVAEDAISRAMQKASELRPTRTPVTPAQQRAWRKLAKELGDELCTLQGASSRDIAEAGVRAMKTEVDRLMTNAAVRAAYEQFVLLCRLTQPQPRSE
jgi:hypothetical protein